MTKWKRSVKPAFGITVVMLTVASSASGAALPFWWWTPKANQEVVWNNPQIGARSHTSTMLKASCAGEGKVRRNSKGARVFHVFRCATWFRDNDTGLIYTPRIHICSSKRIPNRILFYGLGVPGCP